MLKFKCDRCGKEMQRDEAWAIILAPGAYAAEGAKERTQGEICGDCAEVLLKEMIYMEAHAGDCHDRCENRSRNDIEGDTCDREATALASQGCRAIQGYNDESRKGEVPAKDCHVASLLAMTKKKNAEGRCITVARIRMGYTQKEIADLMYTEDSTISSYERGAVQKIPWDELYRVMPELEEIRKNGCKAYCEDPTACLGGGKCYYARRW